MIRYLISDGAASLDEGRWLANIAVWLERGVDFIQIRERDLSARRLAELTRQVLHLPNPRGAKILVNDRADIALACGADGVHIRDGGVLPDKTRLSPPVLVTAACHDATDVLRLSGADYILLGPVFAPLSKNSVQPPLGLKAIQEAVRLTPIPIFALGGITESNARLCIEAGAAGVAGISLFAQGKLV